MQNKSKIITLILLAFVIASVAKLHRYPEVGKSHGLVVQTAGLLRQSFHSFLAMTVEPASAATINTSPANSLKTGLVGWWTFDGMDTTVNTTTDKSANGNDGTRKGNTKLTLGKIGQGLHFDGQKTTYVSYNAASPTIQPNLALATNTPATVSAWVKLDSCGSYPMIVSIYGNGNQIELRFEAGTCKPTLLFGGNILSATTANSLGKWYHIVGRFDGTNESLFVNGVSAATPRTASYGTAEYYFIGNRPFDANYPLNGTIDDLRVYNRALSLSEIQQLYKQGGGKINTTPMNPLLNGLMTWWTFDGADISANTTTDKSGYGNNGRRIGSTTLTKGKIGQGLKLNGTTGYITSTLNGLDTTSTNVTVSFWLNPSNVNLHEFLFLAQPDVGTNRFGISFPYWGSGDTNSIYWDYGDLTSGGRLNFGFNPAWYNQMAHWVFISQAGVGQKVYRNGVLIGSDGDASAFVKGTKALEVGHFASEAVFYKGILDDVRIYNRALSLSEVQALYKQGGGKINKTPVNPLLNGLTGWWTMDGMDTTAVTSTDKSGNGNNGTRVGGTSLQLGKIGQGMKFNGVDAYFNTNKPLSTYMSSSTGSISVWVKPTGVSPDLTYSYNGQTIVGDGQNGGYGYVGLYRGVIGGLDRIWAEIYVGSEKRIGITYDTNKWVHLVWVHANGNLYAYKDGRLVDSVAAGNLATLVTNLEIGWNSYNGTYYLNGSIDDVRIYNRALSASEVYQLYKMGK